MCLLIFYSEVFKLQELPQDVIVKAKVVLLVGSDDITINGAFEKIIDFANSINRYVCTDMLMCGTCLRTLVFGCVSSCLYRFMFVGSSCFDLMFLYAI